MKLIVDMNLSPSWAPFLESHGFTALHWSVVGNVDDADEEIVHWAQQNGFVIFTNDLDFGAILASGGFSSPSVIQVRSDSLLPKNIGDTVIFILKNHSESLLNGAFVSFDLKKVKLRILPIR